MQQTLTVGLTITIQAPLQVTSGSPPAGAVGQSYSHQIAVQGGTSPYSFSVIAGALPPGLNLSSSGLLSGVPSSAGNFSVDIRVLDSGTP